MKLFGLKVNFHGVQLSIEIYFKTMTTINVEAIGKVEIS